MILEINGQAKKVNNNGEMPFVRGDIITVNDAYLKKVKNAENKIDIVSIMGRKSMDGAFLDVRKKKLDSSVEFVQKDASLDSEGFVYGLAAITKNQLHGVVYLRRVEPVLSYIDVLINDKKRVMREGEILEVKKSDHFKIVNVVTNIGDSKNVTFMMVPVYGGKNISRDIENYQIIFRHKDYVFAKIPLKIEGI